MNEETPRRDNSNEPPYRARPQQYDRGNYPQPKQTSVVGVFSLVIGIISLPLSFIPCIGVFGLIAGVVGLMLGLIAILVARSSNHGMGLPISGTIVNFFAVIIAGAWLIVLGVMSKQGVEKAAADMAAQMAAQLGSMSITAVALDNEFDANEVAAEAKYKGKMLIVTGTVKKITRDDKPGKITIELAGTPNSTVDCHFATTQKDELSKVAVGSEVSILGTCRGKVKSFVTLADCIFAPNPNPVGKVEEASDRQPVEVAADAIAKDYRGNIVSADAKYKDKMVAITGKVARVARNKPGLITVELETEAGSNIDCDFASKDGQSQLGELTAGDLVTIRGSCRGMVDDTVRLDKCALVKD